MVGLDVIGGASTPGTLASQCDHTIGPFVDPGVEAFGGDDVLNGLGILPTMQPCDKVTVGGNFVEEGAATEVALEQVDVQAAKWCGYGGHAPHPGLMGQGQPHQSSHAVTHNVAGCML